MTTESPSVSEGIERTISRIEQLRAMTGHYGGTVTLTTQEYDLILAALRRRAPSVCPYIKMSDEGTSYCSLAERAPEIPEELLRLSEKATQGEWQEGVSGQAGIVSYDGADIVFVASAAPYNRALIAALVNWFRALAAAKGEKP